MYKHIRVPTGEQITVNTNFSINLLDKPTMPYIEGDGTGFDITPLMIRLVDDAVQESYL